MIKKLVRHSITREELYDLVWTRPIMDVAKDFGMSDRGLGKACERYNIPKPPRGYWQKIASGTRIQKPKLPVIKDKWLETVRIEGYMKVKMEDSLVYKIKEQATEQVTMLTRLSNPNPLINETEKTICKDLRQRRNLILHTLFSELEKNGYEIEIEDGYFKISYEKEEIFLRIFEHMKEHKRLLTEAEQKKKYYTFQKWHYEYEATGRLKINLNRYISRSYSSGLLHSFVDSKTTLVETKINDIYLAIIEWILSRKEERLKREEEERTRKEREKQARIKKKKQELLIEEAKNYITAKSICEYIEAKEKSFQAGKIEMINFNEWKTFALNYASELDSSLKNEVEVVDDYVEYRYW